MGENRRANFLHTLLKMNITTWLSLVVAVIALATPAQSAEPRVVCYYTNWSVYRPGTARFNPQNINPYLCTHLVYAFGGFTKDNTLKPFDKYQDIEKGGYAKFTGLKTYNKKLKTMLAIGGWNEGSSRFSPMVASRGSRKEFVRNSIKFLRQNHFDGLDLDWEYPAFRDGGKPKDRENYAKLVKELREEFEREAEKTGKPRLLLTMAVPAGIEYIQKGFDVKTLNQYLDWMNLLTYDYHSAFEPAVNHHAPLYPLEEPNEYSVDTELNIDYTIKFYLENGADRDKLVLGIPTYGRSYTLFNPDAVEIGAPADGPGEQGDATREKGYLAYYEICESLKPKNNKRKKRDDDDDDDSEELSEEEEDEEWTVMHPNPKAMGPVAYKGNQWVGYDDIDIVQKKAEYVAENGLGGIMFWSIDNDDFRGNCHNKPYPLIEAAKEAYIVKLGSTDNSLVSAQPPSARGSARRRSRPRPRPGSSTSSSTTTSKPSPARTKSSNRKSAAASTTPTWNLVTPEPPTTPDPGSDFKCTDEGFFQHPRDCKKYFWCLDSGPSNLGIVAHQFTCPSGLFFNKAADSCDFARNVLCKKPSATTKAPTMTTPASTTTRKPLKLSTRSTLLFRTTTTTTTPEPESEEEYEEDLPEDSADIEAEDPKVIKELIDLIRKVGGVEQLEKHLHLGESFASTDGAQTTTPSVFNKKLYQKVLERTRGTNKYVSNSISDRQQNSRGGPQNAGLEAAADKDKLLRKDRPQYTTINRSRPSTSAPEPEASDEEEDQSEEQLQQQQFSRARAVESENSVGTSTKPLQYVNIRRARPTSTTSDVADNTASRNALFERVEPYVTVSDSSNSLDIVNARRENHPEYVTIRRQRPSTEETTTAQYENTVQAQETESQNTALEREISSQPQYLEREISSQPQYTSIVRARATTETTTIDEPSSPEPTTVLAVQISSLLNSPSSAEIEEETSPADEVTETAAPTTSTTTSLAPSSVTPRRTLIRRRGSTSTTTSTPTTTTQVSSRNYTFVRRRRPLSRPNDIASDSVLEADELPRKIRSTTPDSREADGNRNQEASQFRRNRIRISSLPDDSVPAAAAPVARGQFRPQLSRDEIISLTPIDAETPQFVEKPNTAPRPNRRFRPRTSTTVKDKVEDSEVSAATVEVRRPNILPRGRSRFTISTTQAPDDELSEVTESESFKRRPAFTRFSPRPFTRGVSTTSSDDLVNDEPVASTRPLQRLPFPRNRPSSTLSPLVQARKLPFPSSSTTEQTLTSEDNIEDEVENKNDDIALSESAIEVKEHEDNIDIVKEVQEIPKRRVVIKKLRTPTSTPENFISTETIPIEESGKRKFRVIRRRPTSTTESLEPIVISTDAPTSAIPKIRRIIRKKIRPVEDVPQIIAKSVGSLNAVQSSSTTELVINYGEKTRTTLLPSSETPTTISNEEELLKLEDDIELKKENIEVKENDEMTEIVEPNEDRKEDEEVKTESEDKPAEVTPQNNETEQPKPEVVIETDQKAIDASENKESVLAQPETETEASQPETTTSSTTVSTSPSSIRTRLPYRPPKRLFTSTTESTLSSSTKTFSRKYNPGVYTSPSSVDSFRPAVTRRPLFTSKIFTRRPFTTARTTIKFEDEEEYSDEEILDEEPENPFAFVPPNQLYTRKPSDDVEDGEEYDLDSSEVSDDEPEEVEPENKFVTKTPNFNPRVVNSNTFRASSTTTELPKRPSGANLNRTSIFTRFRGNKPVGDNKNRVQNVPQGYNVPVASGTKPNATSEKSNINTVKSIKVEDIITTTDSGFEINAEDDDFLFMSESTLADTSNTDDATSTNAIDNETTTEMEISTDDYLEYNEGTINYPSTQYTTANTEAESITSFEEKTELNSEVTTESLPTTTTILPQVSPIVKTQFDKLFSVSRIVEVSSKLDKHRLNKNNVTTLIEEGKLMVEQKPVVDKIGEVSRFSLIKIVEDEIPLYLTKLGHVYPVENPPDNLIRIDEGRNARALSNFADAPRENLVASESVNEAYRHIKSPDQEKEENNKDIVEHLISDDILGYINDKKKTDKSTEEPDSYTPEWQFVPAAYENEKIGPQKSAKSFEIVTPRSVRTDPSTLPLEALFKTETPMITARKISDNKGNQPFVVYSASVPTHTEDANIVKLEIIKPETGRSIVTFAKGQEFQGAPTIEKATIKYPIDISVIPLTSQITTEAISTTSLTTDSIQTSPIINLLTTTEATPTTSEAQTTSTDAPSTTETVPDETTTPKIIPLDAKRSKFAFPRRPIIKPTNFTRPAPRTIKKIDATVVSNSNQKYNKTTGFNPSKTRFAATRSQNVPIDLRKKAATKLPKTFSTESPRTTTERKLYFKPIRPAFRPAFVPRKATTTPQTNEET